MRTRIATTNDGVRKGAATVELAMVLPLLLFMLFSIIEVGYLVKNRMELGQAAREASRAAIGGAVPATLTERIGENLPSINIADVQTTYDFRHWDTDTGAWGNWQVLGTDGIKNNARQGDQIRIRLSCGHTLMIHGLTGSVLGADENGQVTLEAAAMLMRE